MTSSDACLQAQAGLSTAPALLLRGGRLGGRGSDAKAIGDALWTLVLGYLDASLAGDPPSQHHGSHQQHAAGLMWLLTRHRESLLQALLYILAELYHDSNDKESHFAGRLLPFSSCSLLTATASGAGTVQEETAAAAETAVDICLGLKRNAQLWQDVAPRFQRARAIGPLLGCLLPRVLAGQLQSLAPEVMQARTGPLLQQLLQLL